MTTGHDTATDTVTDSPRLTIEVSCTDTAVYLWVADLSLYGAGVDLPSAIADLTIEISDYLDAWHDRLHRAPNHAANRTLVEQLTGLTPPQLTQLVRSSTTTGD
jgi:hypothetical protein